MKVEDLTVEVKAKISVDRRTAEACLKLVEMYINESGAMIIANKLENGEVALHYEFVG